MLNRGQLLCPCIIRVESASEMIIDVDFGG